MDLFLYDHGHPNGVLPAGNAYFSSKKLLLVRLNGLGFISSVSDEILVDILSYLNGLELCFVSITSRALYVFSLFNDLWRDLVLRFQNNNVNFCRTWKDTYIIMFNNAKKKENKKEHLFYSPLKVEGIYSSLLHRSWSCSTCDFLSAFPGFYTNDNISKRDASELSIIDFVNQYEIPNIPVVITNAVNEWPAFTKWTRHNLVTSCRDALFRATSATAPESASFTMEQYFNYSQNTIGEEAPLYLFERNFINLNETFKTDYTVPTYFQSSNVHRTDLFQVFEKQRPDYQWLIVGPKRSGSIFHIDPNQTNAWNVPITGRKKWVFYPPSVTPPGIVASANGSDVTIPISIGEWLLSFWKYHLIQYQNGKPSEQPIETIVGPGDVIFVPHGYWHMVINLEESIALTHNYVSTSNLADCLRFLREKTDQISGIRDRKDAIQAEDVYEQFLIKLADVLPKDQLQRAVERSYQSEQPLTKPVHQRKKKKKKSHHQPKPQGEEAPPFSFSFDL